jgi:hypothetical protein
MNKFYFNTEDGVRALDPQGMELASVEQARRKALGLMSELLTNGSADALLNGGALRLWVTNGPRDSGHTVYSLQISALESDLD